MMTNLVIGGILMGCGVSTRLRFSLLQTEAERSFAFWLVGVFIYANALQHAARVATDDIETLLYTLAFESIVSTFTAFVLGTRAFKRWIM